MKNMPCKWRLDVGQIEVVDEAVAAMLRTKTPAERVAMANAAHRLARAILTAQVQRQHPDWAEPEVQREVARRLLHGSN